MLITFGGVFMYCRNCGNEMHDEAVICVKCGVPVGKGNSYCAHCGAEVAPEAVICPVCGIGIAASQPQQVNAAGSTESPKSKLAAGLLGIFLGGFGVHNFYLGFTGKAVGQLLLGTIGFIACGIGPVVSGIWGLIEGIMYLAGSKTTDAKGRKLGE